VLRSEGDDDAAAEPVVPVGRAQVKKATKPNALKRQKNTENERRAKTTKTINVTLDYKQARHIIMRSRKTKNNNTSPMNPARGERIKRKTFVDMSRRRTAM
jgi:hypothetical protein